MISPEPRISPPATTFPASEGNCPVRRRNIKGRPFGSRVLSAKGRFTAAAIARQAVAGADIPRRELVQ